MLTYIFTMLQLLSLTDFTSGFATTRFLDAFTVVHLTVNWTILVVDDSFKLVRF